MYIHTKLECACLLERLSWFGTGQKAVIWVNSLRLNVYTVLLGGEDEGVSKGEEEGA